MPHHLCPHCGVLVNQEQAICANCGTLLDRVWPPAPTTETPHLPVPARTLTGRIWGDFLLGAAVQYLVHLVTARVLVATQRLEPANDVINAFNFDVAEIFWAGLFGFALYYGLRRFSTVTARGSGYVTLALLAVLLGALFTCHVVRY